MTRGHYILCINIPKGHKLYPPDVEYPSGHWMEIQKYIKVNGMVSGSEFLNDDMIWIVNPKPEDKFYFIFICAGCDMNFFMDECRRVEDQLIKFQKEGRQ